MNETWMAMQIGLLKLEGWYLALPAWWQLGITMAFGLVALLAGDGFIQLCKGGHRIGVRAVGSWRLWLFLLVVGLVAAVAAAQLQLYLHQLVLNGSGAGR